LTFLPKLVTISYMEETVKKHRNPVVVALRVILVLILIIVLPLAGMTIASLVGRVPPSQAIPVEYLAYVQLPTPVDTVSRIVSDESFSILFTEPSLVALAPLAADLRASGILEKPLVRFLGNRSVDAALLQNGQFIAAIDSGFFSSWLRLFPVIVPMLGISDLTVLRENGQIFYRFQATPSTPGATSVQAYYITVWKNLILIAPDTHSLLLNVIHGDRSRFLGTSGPLFRQRGFDVGILLSSTQLVAGMPVRTGIADAILRSLVFEQQAEIAITLTDSRLRLSMSVPVDSDDPSLSSLLNRQSMVPSIYTLLPQDTQYATVIAAGSLQDLLQPALGFSGPEFDRAWRQGNTASRTLLGMSLEDLLFSWTGSEFALFALAGRHHPVFALQVADEQQRRAVFEKLFSSFAVSEDTTVVLDGVRVPQIKLPDFLSGILRFWNITIPAPYYLEQDGFLFLSESPENLVATLNSIRRNRNMLRTPVWRTLSGGANARASLSLFYSLDRVVPFFLRGNSTIERTLRLYRQGLAGLALIDGRLEVTLTVIPGDTQAARPLGGYPIKMQGSLDNRIEVILYHRRGESRIVAVEDRNRVVSINPVGAIRTEYQSAEPVWITPAEGFNPRTASENSLWVLGERGTIVLMNGDLEPASQFPIATGIRPTAAPRSFDRRLYFPDGEGNLIVVDSTGTVAQLKLPFAETLRSSPIFFQSGETHYMAAYPRSFFGKLWLMDINGLPLPGWPNEISGIANGAPFFVQHRNQPGLALLTKAGELVVYSLDGTLLPGFPVQLPGVFSVQPVFDNTFIWALSESGMLYQVSTEGMVLSQPIRGLTATAGFLVAADTDGDRIPEIYVTGDGNTLFGYTRNFTPRDGFPLAAWGLPFFGDFNGDGKIECLAPTLENTLAAWQLR